MPSPFDPAFFDPAFFGSSAIGEGTQQAFITGRDNQRFGYWVDGDVLKGAAFDAADGTLISEFTVVASGVDDAGIAVDESTQTGGLWRVVLFYHSGGALQERYSHDGQNFS